MIGGRIPFPPWGFPTLLSTASNRGPILPARTLRAPPSTP